MKFCRCKEHPGVHRAHDRPTEGEQRIIALLERIASALERQSPPPLSITLETRPVENLTKR